MIRLQRQRRVPVVLLFVVAVVLLCSNININTDSNNHSYRSGIIFPVVVQGYVLQSSSSSSSSVVRTAILYTTNRPLVSSSSSSSYSCMQRRRQGRQRYSRGIVSLHENTPQSQQQKQTVAVQFNITLTDDRIRKLYAWICQAYYSDDNDDDDRLSSAYSNLVYGMIAVFGNLPPDSPIMSLLNMAIQRYDDEHGNSTTTTSTSTSSHRHIPMGIPLSQYERERASLGAMGAGQWMGQYTTRPHALLDITNFTCIEEYEKSISSRGCRRTLQRAVKMATTTTSTTASTSRNSKSTNTTTDSDSDTEQLEGNPAFTVVSKPIRADQPAPHSTYEHFKCVVQHEVRLLSNMYGSSSSSDDDDSDGAQEFENINVFLNALSEAISRYMGTTQMTGLIREYRSTTGNNEVIAFAHEVRKGQTIRGQWFYATDMAAKQYVWFHSVRSLIERAIEENMNHERSGITNTDGINNTSTAKANIFPFSINPLRRSNNNSNQNQVVQKPMITIVDLGPSGSDDFSQLKAKYGFVSVNDWPSIANYHGPFWDYHTNTSTKNGVNEASFLRNYW